ncbi:hypothetical protein QAD02_018360 [Eretmocerus hayati]|uniref:Uncharacterized protein n=1 Tax=Eretmocerus hayati TaxID=131215 RepID=A0ACC2PGH5_9HYME|nr:hypothetical protein QAD02_018360 [Eretmocerus hayati]
MWSNFIIISFLCAANAIYTGEVLTEDGVGLVGKPQPIEKYPYHVTIEELPYFCAGSIISTNYVITSASCVTDAIYYNLTVRTGSNVWNEGGVVHKIQKVMAHEKHKLSAFGTPENDIALVRVTPPFKFDKTVQPIEMFKSTEKVKHGEMANVTGMGETEMSPSSELLVVDLPIVAEDICDFSYVTMGGIASDQICAGFIGEGGNGKSPCYSDGGAPLAVSGRLAGVLSWQKECGEPYKPAVFSEIAYHRSWIDHHISNIDSKYYYYKNHEHDHADNNEPLSVSLL